MSYRGFEIAGPYRELYATGPTGARLGPFRGRLAAFEAINLYHAALGS